MNKIVVSIVFVILATGGYWWWLEQGSDNDQTKDNQPVSENEVSDTNTFIEREPSSSDRLVYINQDWRFSFEYPSNWEIKERTFRSASSMFNMSVWPVDEKANFPDPVLVNITPKFWIDRLLSDIEQQDNDPKTILIDDQDAIVSTYISHSVIESIQYHVLANQEYWVSLSGQIRAGEVQGYEEELEIVRSSFKFHDPLPTLDDLGITPPTP